MPNFMDEQLEDLVFNHHDNETENYNSDFDSDDDLGEYLYLR